MSTIYWFAHLHSHFKKKAMYEFIRNYWHAFFPKLPSYQTFVARLNQLGATFQALGAALQAQVRVEHVPEVARNWPRKGAGCTRYRCKTHSTAVR